MELRGRTAVITGAGSGIGRGLAQEAAARGMNVVVADIDEAAALDTAELLPGPTLVQKVDVANAAAVDALAQTTFSRFGEVCLLFNNAGILVDGTSWERSSEEWRWTFDVNVMGVVNGVKAFVPGMIRQQSDGIIINTASVGGLFSAPFLATYCASKYAVVGITESLNSELSILYPRLRAACLAPTQVATSIWDSERLRPMSLGKKAILAAGPEADFSERVSAKIARGMDPKEHARFVFDKLLEGKFWIYPEDAVRDRIEARHRSILEGSSPPVS